jgi:hypothetical protein
MAEQDPNVRLVREQGRAARSVARASGAAGVAVEGAKAAKNERTASASARTHVVKSQTNVRETVSKEAIKNQGWQWRQQQRQQQQMAKAAQHTANGTPYGKPSKLTYAVNEGTNFIPSGGGSHGSFGMLFMSGIFAIFGMILLYDFLTHPSGTSTFLNTLRDSISSISQVAPMFTTTNKQSGASANG